MIREYAVQPQLLTDRRMCRILTDSFGVSRGRLISRFPDIWEELVQWAIAESPPVQRTQIVEAFARLKHRMIDRDSTWNGADLDDWLPEAEAEDLRMPFTAIIANQNPRKSKRVLEEDQLDEMNPLWNVETTRSISRTAKEIAECGALLLASAKEVIFVDPYFDPNDVRYHRPLERLLDLCRRTSQSSMLRVEFHTSTNCGTSQHVSAMCAGPLAGIVPIGVPFRVVRWEASKGFHNRYVLTNRGGLLFGHGLDDGEGSDDVSLLSDSNFSIRWREFQRSTATMTYVDEFLVAGRRK
jgi:hypothetical protein